MDDGIKTRPRARRNPSPKRRIRRGRRRGETTRRGRRVWERTATRGLGLGAFDSLRRLARAAEHSPRQRRRRGAKLQASTERDQQRDPSWRVRGKPRQRGRLRGGVRALAARRGDRRRRRSWWGPSLRHPRQRQRGRRGSRDDARRLAEGRTRDGNDPEERDCRWDAEMGGGWAAMATESVAVAAAAVRDSMQDWASWAARRQHSAFPKARDALLALDAASKRRS